MKTCVRNLVFLPWLIIVVGLILSGRATAQTFTTLHSFSALSNGTNDDGANPVVGLALSGNILYGAADGGSFGRGTVFRVTTEGTGFTNLYSFRAVSGNSLTNGDGASPNGLIISGNTLYGTASGGGSFGEGTVFACNTESTAFTNLRSFTARSVSAPYGNIDGASPEAGLVLSGNTLYGTAYIGGSSNYGTVFAQHTDSSGFTNLHNFTAVSGSIGGHGTNSDGELPWAGLILSGHTLYGTAAFGGSSGAGTVFAINTDGSGFTNLHSFTATPPFPYPATNSDGVIPLAGLILSGNRLYGTTLQGGLSANGTVFAVNTNGTGFTNLHNFTALDAATSTTNGDGANPRAGLVLSGNTLYGTASLGGSQGVGTLFAVNTDGTGFKTLYSFTARANNGSGSITNSDGAKPYAGLILSGNTLYGTAYQGGSSGAGTVFSLSLPLPQLSIIRSGVNVILTWPTNATGFALQSTTNLGSSAVWVSNSPAPVVVNGQNMVTNPISGTPQFFRLSQ